jgi:hypothetical protein
VTTSILAQIAPQRTTQYAALADALAAPELRLCPLGDRIAGIAPVRLGGQDYLRFELPAPPDAEDARELGTLAMTSAHFVVYPRLGEHEGPFLRPIETGVVPTFPPGIVEARRYKGKTNELFTHFLCNLARFSSAFARRPWDELRVLDPLAGGGTTLFTALVLGAEAAGVERDAGDVQSTVAFVKEYCREAGIPYRVRDERLQRYGNRWTFTLGDETPRRLILARSETAQARALVEGFAPHLVVADLPYGFQHQGPLVELLTGGLPAWAGPLRPGGALALAWDATRFPRTEMAALIRSAGGLTVLEEPPYDALAHRVDRAIKRRDVLVARREQPEIGTPAVERSAF